MYDFNNSSADAHITSCMHTRVYRYNIRARALRDKWALPTRGVMTVSVTRSRRPPHTERERDSSLGKVKTQRRRRMFPGKYISFAGKTDGYARPRRGIASQWMDAAATRPIVLARVNECFLRRQADELRFFEPRLLCNARIEWEGTLILI